MRQRFFEFYPPNENEYERLWKEGLIILDTNVLLNLYRLPATARDEFLSILHALSERLWIPHHVALEFQRRRLTVISAERRITEEILKYANEYISLIKQKVLALQIDKHGLDIEAEPLLKDLDDVGTKLSEAVTKVHASQLDVTAADPIRKRLDQLLAGKIGTGPTTQQELDSLIRDGEDRFRDEIPPGFEDAGKDKNPKEPVAESPTAMMLACRSGAVAA